jgi:predicted ATPase/DNA-binding SARP family transcriptional activator
VLGPIRVLRDGRPIDIGGIRAETLLALLALRAPAPVSADALIDELWAGEPPEGAATTLRSYVSRLRSALGDAPIERASGGYALEMPRESIDVGRFEALARDGLELQRHRRHRRAAAGLRAALELWRGEPFAGISVDGVLRTETARLEELHMQVLEARIESELELGRDAELVDELEALVARHPFRERLWRLLMLALYRTGRQADALAAYHRARAALAEELGIDPGVDLQALEAAILRQDVPPPAAVPTHASAGLPTPLTGFVGRGPELDEIHRLLERSRLVTLVGVGGVGKTRLALESARRAATDLVDGVVVVDLVPVSDPDLVQAHIAAALGLRELQGTPLEVALRNALRGGDMLLVLDNCEHVREAAALVARDLLEAAPDLRILATSREILDVPGEAAFPVPPMGVPDVGDVADRVRESESVRLLVDRATLSRHGLTLDAAAYETAARICRELDGLPLAIELAAARAKVLSLDEIAGRLRDRFRFLVSERRLTAARHRTLREAMDWSYELLEPDERALLARLSVFPGGATLRSIAAVCLDGDEDGAERLVERLADASLVTPVETRSGTRFRLLETVREYAAEQVPEADRGALHRRHAEHVRSLAESTNLALETSGRVMDFPLAQDELPSIRAAVQWAAHEDPALGLEIACALERFWVTNQPREGAAVFDALVDAPDLPDVLRARGYRCRGGPRYAVGEFERGAEDYERSLAIFRRLGRRADQAQLLMRLAMEAQRVGDIEQATSLYDEAAAVGGDERYVPDGYVGKHFEAERAFNAGRPEEALDLLRLGADLAGRAHDTWWRADLLISLAYYAMGLGRLDDVGAASREALTLSRDIGHRQSIVYSLSLLAREAASRGLGTRAGRLWGGLEAEVDRGGPVGQWESEQASERGRIAALAGLAFEAGVVEGRQLSLDAVTQEALTRP